MSANRPNRDTLRSRHAGVRDHLARRADVAAWIWGGVSACVVLLSAWALAGADGWRAGQAAPLALDLVLLASVAGVVILWRRWRKRRLNDGSLAREMERVAGLSDGLVSSGLELSERVPAGVSPALVARGEHVLLGRLTQAPADLAGNAGLEVGAWIGRGARALAVLIPAALLVLVATPERTTSVWRGLAAPLGVLATPALPPLAVAPGSVEVPRGSPLQVRVVAGERETVELHWQVAGDVARSTTLEVLEGRAAHGFAEVTASFEYWVSAPDGARSPVHEVTPLDPLYVSDIQVRLVFPDYASRAAEEYRGEIPPLEVPAGTRVEVEGHGSRTLGAANLLLEGDEGDAVEREALTLTVEGSGFRGAFTPRRSGRYSWHLTDASGGPAALVPEPLEILLAIDQAPTVALRAPGRDTVLPLALRQVLVIEAEDDYGLERLELVAWRVTALGEALEPRRQTLDLGGLPGALARPVLDLNGWGLLPGDHVRYYARVEDTGTPAQEARTGEFRLLMPDAAELRRNAQDELDRSAEELADLARRAAEGADQARAMERQAAAPDRSAEGVRFRNENADGSLDFEARENLRRALEEQRAMAARVDSLRQALGELSSSMQQAGVRDPELGSDLRELQALLDEVSTPEMQARLEELAGRLDEMNRTRARDALAELAEQEEAFRERLDEALDRMRRAAAQQDFRSTTREAQELADQERALAEAMSADQDPAGRAEQQDELAARASEMEDRMERLGERLQELGEEEAAAGVQDAREQAEQALADMSEAAQSARSRQGDQASRQAQSAAEGLSEAARQLQKAQEQMMEERVEALRQALDQTAQDALSLARRQGDIRESMRGASAQELADLRSDESALEQGLRNMAENLSVASRAAGAPGAEREVGATMGQAMGAVSETVSALDGATGANNSPGSAADRAVEALNELALQALAVSSSLAEGGDGAGTSEDMLEALERLAQEQANVNNQASQMMPMQLGPEAMQQQMQQMSEGQQSVASDLGELSNQEGDGPLGDLEALAGEAEALARELAQGRLEPETRQRQERLFHRLLDAGRSLEKDEYSEERESGAPGAFERGEVSPLGLDALGMARFRQPDPEALRRLTPAARALVIRYFQRLNERGGPPSPGGGR